MILHDLRGVGLRQRSAEDGEVLREREDLAAVDEAVAGDDAVARHDLIRHAEVAAAVCDELVDFLERARIEQRDRSARAAVSLPAACWRSSRSAPPPSSARRSRSASVSAWIHVGAVSCGSAGSISRQRAPISHPSRALRLHRLCFLPVLQELLEPDVR